MENHYQTLGVAENATQDEIKRAYRKLAMEWHPDKNANNSAAEEKFKKINAAYAEIGEPDARAKYDQMRKFGGRPNNAQFHDMHNNQFGFNFNFAGGNIDDIINQFFSQHGFGHPRQARNRDFNFNLHITLEDAFNGKQTPVHFNVDGHDYNLTVNIPAGIENGSRIRYQGYGDKANTNAPPGDLYIQVQILDHSVFRREGANLYTTINVDALSAIVGTDQEIKCIDGSAVTLTIPPGTQPGSHLRLRERGMPTRHSTPHTRGDCIVTVNVTVPTNLSDTDKETLKTIIVRKGT